MAHFAEIDENNIVLRIHVVSDSDCLDVDGVESEEVGKSFCSATWGGNWVQASYNGRMRVRYPGIGYSYDPIRDAFIPPKPLPSWIFSETDYDWVPPIPYPATDPEFSGISYSWDEESLQWIPQPLFSEE